MEQDQICQLLKEIIPELQAKIRMQMQTELEQKLSAMQAQYQQEIQKLLNQHNQTKNQYERQIKAIQQQEDKQVLYNRIAMLESQRNNWCMQQAQYQATIQELTTILASQSMKSKLNAVSVYNSNKKTMAESKISNVSAIHPPPKTDISLQNLYPVFKKQKKQKPNVISNKEQIRNERLASNPNSETNSRVCLQESLSKYVKQDDYTTEEQNKQHYRSVLSPPKLEPAQTAKPIFWDQNKKKHLLSLIKLH